MVTFLPYIGLAEAWGAGSTEIREDDIITPHPGEAARLLATTTTDIQADRFAAATALQDKFGSSVVLKGAGSLVQAAGSVPAVIGAGNPGMGVGGTGDLHDAGQQPLGAGAHVHRRAAQPQAIDADHLSRPELSSRSQAVQSPAAEVGQRTLRCSGPRRNSM